MRTTYRLSLACLLALGLACGDDDSPTPGVDSGTPVDAGSSETDSGTMTEDAGTMTADAGTTTEDGGTTTEDAGTMTEDAGSSGGCTDLEPTQGADRVIISQIDFTNRRMELCNASAADINTDGLLLCNRPQYPAVPTTTIPAGECVIVDWPSSLNANTVGGELAIYTSNRFSSRNNMSSFVCWGSGLSSGRKSLAEMAEGGGTEVLWRGDCAPEPTGGVLVRRVGTAGIEAGDYEVADSLTPRCE